MELVFKINKERINKMIEPKDIKVNDRLIVVMRANSEIVQSVQHPFTITITGLSQSKQWFTSDCSRLSTWTSFDDIIIKDKI